ncbi:hypothetical protein RIF29_23829 [Crotalaria pallida]|uniref:Uncharacterized protein n=1 Tax=Crotalaria pallida TaxID=3830 RepID=A0AAN9FAP9_CROPI
MSPRALAKWHCTKLMVEEVLSALRSQTHTVYDAYTVMPLMLYYGLIAKCFYRPLAYKASRFNIIIVTTRVAYICECLFSADYSGLLKVISIQSAAKDSI